jgi:hypothetical protein
LALAAADVDETFGMAGRRDNVSPAFPRNLQTGFSEERDEPLCSSFYPRAYFLIRANKKIGLKRKRRGKMKFGADFSLTFFGKILRCGFMVDGANNSGDEKPENNPIVEKSGVPYKRAEVGFTAQRSGDNEK